MLWRCRKCKTYTISAARCRSDHGGGADLWGMKTWRQIGEICRCDERLRIRNFFHWKKKREKGVVKWRGEGYRNKSRGKRSTLKNARRVNYSLSLGIKDKGNFYASFPLLLSVGKSYYFYCINAAPLLPLSPSPLLPTTIPIFFNEYLHKKNFVNSNSSLLLIALMSQGLPKNSLVKNLILLDLNYFEVVRIAQSLQWLSYGPKDLRFDFG